MTTGVQTVFCHSLNIGGICLNLYANRDASFSPSPDIYHPFTIARMPSLDAISIDIYLDLDESPETSGLTKIFETGDAWSMSIGPAGRYVLSFNPPGAGGTPLWTASFGHDMKIVSLRYSDMLKGGPNSAGPLQNPLRYPLDQILFMYALISNHGLLVHSAGLKHGAGTFIFPGRSGAGKSTISKLISSIEDTTVLSDDRMAVRRHGGIIKASGTPWAGDARIALNEGGPLKGLLFLVKGAQNRIAEISPRRAVELLLPVISAPWFDKSIAGRALEIAYDIAEDIPAYEFSFTPDKEAADCLEKFLYSI